MHAFRPAFLLRHVPGALAVLLCAGGVATASTRHADRLILQRAAPEQAEARLRAHAARRATLPAFLHDTKRNARLHRRGLLTSPARRARQAQRSKASLAAVPDTVQVLLVRLGFAANRAPDLTSMDTTGDFRLAPDPNAIVDPPPHDVLYFEKQLEAMRGYYDVMSDGRVVLETRVFPPDGEPSIKLSDVADYGPGSSGFWTLEGLETYFRDAVATLDSAASGRLDLAPYAFDSTGTRLGALIFAHPGSDLQNDINRDSPNDLPTFFIALGDSIAVQSGTQEVRAGLIIPETTSQDGALGGIQGALCHEFGHALGLPDWYSTRTGLPVVGEWSLMDSGNAAFFAFAQEGMEDEPIFALGLLPTSMSALDRYLLGWVDPYVVQAPADSVRLRPSNADRFFSDDPTAALLPISPDEYFLVENRRDLHAFRALQDADFCPYLNREPQTGVVLWMSKDNPALPAEARRNSREYDFWIAAPTAPEGAGGSCGELGYGVIVWHVDERPIVEGLPTNQVNTSFTHRGKRVIEASGDFEIGDFNQSTISFLGDGWNDPFRAGYRTQLRVDTVPNNWNNDWARTGWEIVDVRDVDPEGHEVVVRALDGVANWPRTFEVAPDSLLEIVPASAVVTAIDGLGPQLIVADSQAVHTIGSPGHAVLQSGAVQPTSIAATTFASETTGTLGAVVDGRVWLASTSWNGSGLDARAGFPLDVPGGAGARLVLAGNAGVGVVETQDGAWVLFDAAGTVLQASLDLESGAREAGVVVGPLRADWPGDELALVSGTRVEFMTLDGSMRTSVPLPFGVGGGFGLHVGAARIDARSTHAQVVVLHADGRLRVVDPANGVLSAYGDLSRDQYLGAALGDVDGDGFADIVAASATRLVGVNSLGAALLNTPRNVREIFALQDEVRITTAPLLADVTGDALPEILFATNLGLVYALDASGTNVPGYPRKALPDLAPSALLAADLDGLQSSREVVAVSPLHAVAFALPGGGANGPAWSSLGGGPGRTGYVAPAAAGSSERLQALERPFIAYPNPARSAQRVRLRIAARSSGPYEIRIYNLEGEQVWERRGMTQTGVQEIEWNVSALASGVYLCRFVSPAAGVTAPLVEPITLLR